MKSKEHAKKWSREFRQSPQAKQRMLLQQRARDFLVAALQQAPELHWVEITIYGGARWEIALRGIDNELLYGFDLDLAWFTGV